MAKFGLEARSAECVSSAPYMDTSSWSIWYSLHHPLLRRMITMTTAANPHTGPMHSSTYFTYNGSLNSPNSPVK